MCILSAEKREVVGEGEPGSGRSGGEPDGFAFQSVNLAQLWSRLALTATQLSRLTGLTRRQVEWWRRRGYLPPSPEASDRFNGDAVTIALLMRQALAAGHPPASAYQLATEHLARRLAAGLAEAEAASPGVASDPATLLELQQRLLATHNTIGLLLDAIAPLLRRIEQEREDNTSEH
jgi:hypothetical protein